MKVTRRRNEMALAALISAGLVAAFPVAALAQTSSTSAGATGATSSTSGTSGTSGAGNGPQSDPRCTTTNFSQARQAVEAALTARVTRLDSLLSDVNSTTNHLTSSDKAALQNDISSVELPGIQALQPQVQSAATCAELRGDAHDMVYNYRVYLVMTPQAHLTIVSDDENDVVSEFVSWEPAIAQAIQNAQKAGKNVTGAQTAFADLEAQVSAAGSSISGESATLLAQTPQGYPGNWTTFLTARTNETNARNDLHTASQDLKTIRADLS